MTSNISGNNTSLPSYSRVVDADRLPSYTEVVDQPTPSQTQAPQQWTTDLRSSSQASGASGDYRQPEGGAAALDQTAAEKVFKSFHLLRSPLAKMGQLVRKDPGSINEDRLGKAIAEATLAQLPHHMFDDASMLALQLMSAVNSVHHGRVPMFTEEKYENLTASMRALEQAYTHAKRIAEQKVGGMFTGRHEYSVNLLAGGLRESKRVLTKQFERLDPRSLGINDILDDWSAKFQESMQTIRTARGHAGGIQR